MGMPPPAMQVEGNAPTLIFGSHLVLALLGVVLAYAGATEVVKQRFHARPARRRRAPRPRHRP